ncbi:brg1-associated factor b [Tremella mesenterica]|uniref:Brg1-associated factor b n=1 Tax=Tremella mesenterica TaxID=5217 RepID=A0A4Q1BVH2_TREME|nr:brg1-associated factor b [Tremella mesenterica]
MVYNGDEVSALVVDFGTHTTRAGYAGEDCPRVVCSSYYGYTESSTSTTTNGNGDAHVPVDGDGDVSMNGNGETGVESGGSKGKRKYYVGDDGVNVWRAGMEVDSFMEDGMVRDPEPASALLHHILHNRLGVDPTEHPLMLTEPAWNTPQAREMLAQMVFEGEQMPAMYFGSSGVLSAFAAGRPTALVLDVGHATSSAVPVVDGYALRAGTMRQPLAGELLLSQIRGHFAAPSLTRTFALSLTPRHLIAKRDPCDPGIQPRPLLRDDRALHTTPSWRAWAENQVVEQWLGACGEMINYKGFDFQTARELPQQLFEFPDGYSQMFGEERYRFTELLFDPKNYFNQANAVSLSQLVHDSIMACDVDVRAPLLQNIVVVGNTSLIKGLTERLDVELAALLPSQKIKIHSPAIPFERKYAPWVGGSVLASLGTFHQLWVTKDEWQEHGMAIINQRELMSYLSMASTTPARDDQGRR